MKGHFKKPIGDLGDKLSRLEDKVTTSIESKNQESDYDRELRFNRLREARQNEREAHPEDFPPSVDWNTTSSSSNKTCRYFPRDWNQTEEEIEFYKKVAWDYVNGRIYRFHTYKCFQAYNLWSIDELSRWYDWKEFGHLHDSDQTQSDWKAHRPDEHDINPKPPSRPPTGWFPEQAHNFIAEIQKRHKDHCARFALTTKSRYDDNDEEEDNGGRR